MHEYELSNAVVDGALTVHHALGLGLLGSGCELVVAYEPARRGLRLELQEPTPIEYQGVPLAEGLRADLIAQGNVLLQLKFVEHLTSPHRKQIQTYLGLTSSSLDSRSAYCSTPTPRS